ncbi:hypothetical protein FE257_005963 [Aspergillus nanangensis]|uniref:Uncharacterized protein n=1 Tax=Aspergillus nanangensis TaxID=2582783 RepID=A0AAD4GMS4_ASPNN|nr:hypothetical protein FE257_005963 [Aspergillus nanangensis]
MASSSMPYTIRPTSPDSLVLEAWGQGYMFGSLLVMIAITMANIKKAILLHKLIVVELLLALGHRTFIFLDEPGYGWYLSITAVGLNVSWSLHNLIAWMKLRGFFSQLGTRLYLGTLLLAQPYWVLEIYANFAFFNFGDPLFLRTRLDPWWIFTTFFLIYKIQRGYKRQLLQLFRISPRFGLTLFFLCLSIAFVVVDTCAILGVFDLDLPTGIEPFWKFAFVFKCLSDTIILDDFKSALEQVHQDRFRDLLQPGDIELRTPQ